jgi:hypothetical protein
MPKDEKMITICVFQKSSRVYSGLKLLVGIWFSLFGFVLVRVVFLEWFAVKVIRSVVVE